MESLGFGQGFISGEHTVPLACRLVVIKHCENCPATFFRYEGSTIKFCGKCRANALQPDRLVEQVRELLPHLDKHPHHLPKYDKIPDKKRIYRNYGDWRARLAEAFKDQSIMTAEQIQHVIGCPGAPYNAIGLCKSISGYGPMFPLIVVGYGQRESKYGRPPRLYARPGTLPDITQVSTFTTEFIDHCIKDIGTNL